MTRPFGPPPWTPAPPRPPRMWLWALTTVILMVVAIAATAAITYAITQSSGTAAAAPTMVDTPSFSAGEQAEAKRSLCQTFDQSTAGQQAQGGVVVDGQPNVAVLLRKIAGVVSITQELVPATPESIAAPARRYVVANLNLMNASLGRGSVDEIKRLTAATNEATGVLADACGLPR